MSQKFGQIITQCLEHEAKKMPTFSKRKGKVIKCLIYGKQQVKMSKKCKKNNKISSSHYEKDVR